MLNVALKLNILKFTSSSISTSLCGIVWIISSLTRNRSMIIFRPGTHEFNSPGVLIAAIAT